MKKIYKVEVDCANCAAKMEQAIKKVSGINDATLNFMTQKLIVDFEDGQNIDAVMQEVYKLCKKIESDFVINL
ncbi:MAG: cation transporter [Acutalibacteraceae bacterium]